MNIKSIVLILFLLTIAIEVNCQNIELKAKVDERTELLSIVFRLAGAEEYSWGKLPDYNRNIDKHFEKYRNHEIIEIAKNLRKSKGISYNAVMSLAIHLEIINSNLKLKEGFSDNSLEKRWDNKDVDKFLVALNDFYVESSFLQFFDSNIELYNLTINRFDSVLNKIDFTWFENFFGVIPEDNYTVIVSLTNGWANYGPKTIEINGFEKLYAIIGAGSIDSLGKPIFSNKIIPTIIHEFSHSFCNHLIDSKSKEFEKSGQKIYSKVKNQMKSQAYGNHLAMLYEYLVRASVIKYIEHIDSSRINLNVNIASEQGKGFYFINHLVEHLSVYESNREKYVSLDKFMPEIIILFDSIANNYNSFYTALYSNCPKIEYTSIKNGSKIDASTTELIIRFDKSMKNSGSGFRYGKGGKVNFPNIKGTKWIDNKTIKLNIALERNKKYTLRLYNPTYLSESFFPVIDDFELTFKTQK